MSDDTFSLAGDESVSMDAPEESNDSDSVDTAASGADLSTIQALFERILPDAGCRQQVAEVLSDIILRANAVGVNRWALTVGNQRHIRLNAGLYVVAEVGKNYLWVGVDTESLDPEALPRLQQLHKWANPFYRSVPQAMGGYIRCHELSEVLPLLHEAVMQFATTCAQQTSRLRSQVRDAHVPAVVGYFRELTGRALPDPDYSEVDAPQQNAFARIDRAAIETAFITFNQERRDNNYWKNWEHDPSYRYVVRSNNQVYPIKEIVRIASGVEHFNSSQARRVLARLGFVIETLRDTAQHMWLFQANPRYYDLAERVASAAIGDEDVWTVTRYREEMHAGEPVVLWLAGAQAGIYAIGELTGEPREHTFPADDIPKWITPNPDGPTTVWQVPFRYTHVLPEPIRKATCQEHPALQQMVVLKVPNGTNFKLTLPEWETIQELLEVRPPAAPPARQTPLYTLPQCAADLGIDAAELSRWLRALERKGQIVLYGPPGTGKTFAAQHLARHLVSGGDGFVELVQFHPAYAYEDFIQGIRPQSSAEGALAYPVVPGRFMAFCDRAKATQDTCVLIIDEINRANLARVFGELMYLLEYRNQVLPLAGGGLLSIPSNVRIIGTMNTADRSIALVDHALRRRFAFLALTPNYDQLRRYHNDIHLNIAGLVSLLERVNLKIADPHYTIGTSFFLRNDLAEQIEDIWRMEIEPYLEEYFFDQPKTVGEFGWEHVRAQVQP